MALTDADFRNILNEHGENVELKRYNETLSIFDAIYGSAHSIAFDSKTIKVVFQEINGTEEWLPAAGDLTQGDAIIFTKNQYTDDGLNFYHIQLKDTIVARGRTYNVISITDERDAGNTIFYEVHIKYVSG